MEKEEKNKNKNKNKGRCVVKKVIARGSYEDSLSEFIEEYGNPVYLYFDEEIKGVLVVSTAPIK